MGEIYLFVNYNSEVPPTVGKATAAGSKAIAEARGKGMSLRQVKDMKGRMPQKVRRWGVASRGGLRWCGVALAPPGGSMPADTETEAAVVVCPQQKSGPTKVVEAGRINLCRRKVCSEPLWKMEQ